MALKGRSYNFIVYDDIINSRSLEIADENLAKSAKLYLEYFLMYGKAPHIFNDPETWFEYEGFWFQQLDSFCPICDAELEDLTKCICGAKKLEDWQVKLGEAKAMAYKSSYVPVNNKGQWTNSCSLTWDAMAGIYRLKFDWVGKDFIDVLKMVIPASERSWEPVHKTWIISEVAFDAISDLVKLKWSQPQIFTKAEYDERAKQYNIQTPTFDPNKELVTFVSLLSKAGIEFDKDCVDGKIAAKAFRRAAMFYHPDRNPDRAGEASDLGAAWMNLQKHFGLQREQVKYDD